MELGAPKGTIAESGYYGVYADGKRWRAEICYGGKTRLLGTFDTKQGGSLAYDRAARECGEEKPLNYESMEGAEEAATTAQAAFTQDLASLKKAPTDTLDIATASASAIADALVSSLTKAPSMRAEKSKNKAKEKAVGESGG